MIEQLYSTKQVAEILSVSVRAVEKWRLEGKIQPVKVGKLNRYPESEIDRFVGVDSGDGTCHANSNYNEFGEAIGDLAESQKALARKDQPFRELL